MRNITATVFLVAAMAAPLGAQGRGGWDRVPPGQLPPPGSCRVWYDGVPPGRQPAPMNCRDAERLASRARNARVIYGNDRYGTDRYGSPDRNRGGYDDRYGNRGGYGAGSVPFQNGYRDGLDKGREDARDRDSFDPVRHGRYRSADRGYNRRYGTREQYKLVYRDGFESGYAEGYRQYRGGGRGNSSRLPWPY